MASYLAQMDDAFVIIDLSPLTTYWLLVAPIVNMILLNMSTLEETRYSFEICLRRSVGNL